MGKIYKLYENKLERAWYDSSNIVYSECDDIENELKVVRITFKDGRTYRYEGVDVNDYLMFRESFSQGKGFNKYLKKYDGVKIDSLDVNVLNETLKTLMEEDECKTFVEIFDDKLNVNINGNVTEILFEGNTKEVVIKLLELFNINFKNV